MQTKVPDDSKTPYVTAVTARTATIFEDSEKSRKANQVCDCHALIIVL